MRDKVADRYVAVAFGDQKIGGVLGDRMRVNLEGRLLNVDEAAILGGFQHRPGKQAWIGEHAGKFLHAAASAYAYSKDARLKEKMDRVARELIACQLPDGYLGTYADDKRWGSWDAWVHKYDLIGLLAYYDQTGDEKSLDACRKIGDLLCKTFGEAPGQIDIAATGEHQGMASTSILEPMCGLYRHTGEQKYLDFCLYITRSIERHSKVISSLSSGKSVDQTANAKAYEMMSNLVGLVELYRITGDKTYLTPAVNAWNDVVAHHLYLTGTSSSHEHFRPAGDLPAGDADDVGEGCVTVTWMQLNLSLLKLTGEAKYADQLERTIYNQLLAAQNPASGDICYFTPMVGHKAYGHDVNCCLSSEPRGIALIPAVAWGVIDNRITMNLYAPGEATLSVRGDDGQPVTVKVKSETDFPATGDVKLTFTASRPTKVMFESLQPTWCPMVGGPMGGPVGAPGSYSAIGFDVDAAGRTETRTVALPTRIIPGGPSYPTSFAVQRGPQLLALDLGSGADGSRPIAGTVVTPIPYGGQQAQLLPALAQRAKRPGDPPTPEPEGIAQYAAPAPVKSDVATYSAVYPYPGLVVRPDTAKGEFVTMQEELKLVPFADAARPQVWLPTKDKLPNGPLPVTFGGTVSASRPGRQRNQGSIVDLSPDTMRVTWDRKPASEDWFAVELPKPAAVGRVVFRHGRSFHDGGWFDASAGKPRVEYQGTTGGEWRPLASLDGYPETSATDARGLAAGQPFEVKLPESVTAAAIRVVGRPACGDDPKQAFSSCAELQAYKE